MANWRRSCGQKKKPGEPGDFVIGGRRRGPFPEWEPEEYRQSAFRGKIASLRIYDRALSHEKILDDFRTTNITQCPVVSTVPRPGLGQIRVEVDTMRLGAELNDLSVKLELLADDADQVSLAELQQNDLDGRGHAIADLSVPPLAQGQYVVRATALRDDGKVVGVPYERGVSWSGSAQVPSEPQAAKRLNNLVTELLHVPGPDDSGTAHTFVNPRTGFIFISNGAAQQVKVTAQDATDALILTLFNDYGHAYETMRYLPAGTYTIIAPLAHDLVVLAVAQTVFDYAHTEPHVKSYGVYAGKFEDQYVFPHANTFLVNDGSIDEPFVTKWQTRGRRML